MHCSMLSLIQLQQARLQGWMRGERATRAAAVRGAACRTNAAAGSTATTTADSAAYSPAAQEHERRRQPASSTSSRASSRHKNHSTGGLGNSKIGNSSAWQSGPGNLVTPLGHTSRPDSRARAPHQHAQRHPQPTQQQPSQDQHTLQQQAPANGHTWHHALEPSTAAQRSQAPFNQSMAHTGPGDDEDTPYLSFSRTEHNEHAAAENNTTHQQAERLLTHPMLQQQQQQQLQGPTAPAPTHLQAIMRLQGLLSAAAPSDVPQLAEQLTATSDVTELAAALQLLHVARMPRGKDGIQQRRAAAELALALVKALNRMDIGTFPAASVASICYSLGRLQLYDLDLVPALEARALQVLPACSPNQLGQLGSGFTMLDCRPPAHWRTAYLRACAQRFAAANVVQLVSMGQAAATWAGTGTPSPADAVGGAAWSAGTSSRPASAAIDTSSDSSQEANVLPTGWLDQFAAAVAQKLPDCRPPQLASILATTAALIGSAPPALANDSSLRGPMPAGTAAVWPPVWLAPILQRVEQQLPYFQAADMATALVAVAALQQPPRSWPDMPVLALADAQAASAAGIDPGSAAVGPGEVTKQGASRAASSPLQQQQQQQQAPLTRKQRRLMWYKQQQQQQQQQQEQPSHWQTRQIQQDQGRQRQQQPQAQQQPQTQQQQQQQQQGPQSQDLRTFAAKAQDQVGLLLPLFSGPALVAALKALCDMDAPMPSDTHKDAALARLLALLPTLGAAQLSDVAAVIGRWRRRPWRQWRIDFMARCRLDAGAMRAEQLLQCLEGLAAAGLVLDPEALHRFIGALQLRMGAMGPGQLERGGVALRRMYYPKPLPGRTVQRLVEEMDRRALWLKGGG